MRANIEVKLCGGAYLNPRGRLFWRVFKHVKTVLLTDNSLVDIAAQNGLMQLKRGVALTREIHRLSQMTRGRSCKPTGSVASADVTTARGGEAWLPVSICGTSAES